MARPVSIYPTELIRRFLDESTQIRTESSRATYRQSIVILSKVCPAVPMHRITEANLARACTYSVTGKALAPNTIASRRANLITFFGWAHHTGLIPNNPAQYLKLAVRVQAGAKRPGAWLDRDQALSLLGVFDDTVQGRRNRTILGLGLFLGLRATEMTKLTWGQIDWDTREILIDGKGQKQRWVGIPDQLADLFKLGLDGHEPAKTDYVVPFLHNSPWVDASTVADWTKSVSYTTIHRVVSEAGDLIGVQLAPHDLRRTYAGLLKSMDLGIEEIKDRMRHSSVATTQIYLARDPRAGATGNKSFTI